MRSKKHTTLEISSPPATAALTALKIAATIVPLVLVGIACGQQGSAVQALSASGAPIEVHAHRGGAAIRPENTLVAFRVAISQVGSDGIELDLHQTSDQHIVIQHDPEINPAFCLDRGGHRIKNPPMVSNLTLEEIQKYDCGTLVGLKKGTEIPTLDDVFDNTQDLKTPKGALPRYDLHLKWDASTIKAADFAQLIVKIVDDHGLLSRVSFMNENPEMLTAVRNLEPTATLIYLAGKLSDSDFDQLKALNVDIVAPIGDTLDTEAATRVQSMGIKLFPWVVNSPAEWEALFKLGVDGIITDNPLALRQRVDNSSITIPPARTYE